MLRIYLLYIKQASSKENDVMPIHAFWPFTFIPRGSQITHPFQAFIRELYCMQSML